MTAVVDAALALRRRGYAVIDLPRGQKRPVEEGWQNLRLTERDICRRFAVGEPNVGVLTGDHSGGLIDVDLDCGEARALAPRFLPATDAVLRPGRGTGLSLVVPGIGPVLDVEGARPDSRRKRPRDAS